MLKYIEFFRKRLFKKQNPPENEILNSGLYFAMQFGENWLKPINQRLLSNYDFLTKKQLDEYNVKCTAAMKIGHDLIYKTLVEISENRETIKENQLKEILKGLMLSEYPWIDSKNLSILFNQGCYYAYKDGLTDYIK